MLSFKKILKEGGNWMHPVDPTMKQKMTRLRISLLGSFRVNLHEEPITGFESAKVRALDSPPMMGAAQVRLAVVDRPTQRGAEKLVLHLDQALHRGMLEEWGKFRVVTHPTIEIIHQFLNRLAAADSIVN